MARQETKKFEIIIARVMYLYIIEMDSIKEATLAYCKQIPHYYISFGIVITVGYIS